MEALQNRLEDDQHGVNTSASTNILASLQRNPLQQASSLDYSAYQVMHIVNSLSSCLQQTRILQDLQVKKHALDQTYANRGLVPPPVDQLEMQSLKKHVHDGYQNLAHTISDVNKCIERVQPECCVEDTSIY